MNVSQHEWLAPFSAAVKNAVSAQLASAAPKPLACFDADGTLWSEDIGEAFFRWLAEGDLLPALTGRGVRDAWHEYEARVQKNRTEGYSWAVQCMAGLKEADVRTWARQLASAWPNYRGQMQGLIRGLTGAGYEVWLVSASNFWVIEASALHLGVDPQRSLGIRVEVENGTLTDRLVHPVTCNAGKVSAIEKHIGRKPQLVVGDSLGDLEMLEYAEVPLVIGRRDRPSTELLNLATKRGWATHLF